MKSIVINNAYGLENIILQEQAIPAIGEHDVLVKVKAISLNQLDLMVARGALQNALPHTLGVDAAGIVKQTGSQVTGMKPGDKVSTHYIQAWQSGSLKTSDLKSRLGAEQPGVFSEYIAVPESFLVKSPANLTFEEAATLPLAGVTAWEAIVNAGQLRAGQTVLIQGTGGVSIFALQFAKALGAKVIITSGTDGKLARAKSLGADEVINYLTDPEWPKRVMEITNGEGLDLALEMSWAEIGKTTDAMKLGGRIAVVGLLGGVTAELSVFGLMLKSLSVIGVQAGSKASFEDMNRAIAVNNIKPVVDKAFPLTAFQDAFAYLDEGQHVGKVVIKF